MKRENRKSSAALLEPPAPRPKVEPEFITFGKPDIGEAEIQAVADVLRSGWLSTGPQVRQLEEEFAAYIGSGYAVAVNSCTMGLVLSMAVSSIGEGAHVITSPMTFPATVNAILAARAKPVFVDCDEHGLLNMDIVENMRILPDKLKAILPIHYAGASCDMRRITAFARAQNIKIIEDAAHAFGTEFVDRAEGNNPGRRYKIGTLGDLTVFSLYPTKNITSGEGGIVMTKRGEWAERIRALSNHGLSASAWGRYGNGPVRHYEVMFPGYKANMSDVHAAIGLVQLKRWTEIRKKRSEIWNIYEDAFGFKEPGHSQHLFTLRVKNRDIFRDKMHEMGIGTGLHFRPAHLEAGYHFLGYKRGDFPVAEKIGDTTVSLPLSSAMTIPQAKRVVDIAKRLKEDTDA